MNAPATSPVTELLDAAGRGDPDAQERLWLAVYDELHRVAQRQMAHEGNGHTLQTTALVSETYLRLIGDGDVQWNNRRHFFAAAAKAMRRILIDHARKRDSAKRGGGLRPVELDDPPCLFAQDPHEVLALDEVIRKLEQESPLRAEVVSLRFYAGLKREEIASAMGITVQAVDRYWRLARLWLHRELGSQ